ncbi:hypothetical protein [Methanococcoides burtonii]|uniref:Uncharacterized protein n=1 Tax=Methanococcoides burtonii (strain DSM 6242 / NBRC 107633 / OCM 468 / ACE-M) TaxID=259564 RepID=Q12YZ9_METBU|nr:hypothetical protein [Methanococcoides burtonii]ABE51327.1 Hypothetical protein Mbur_0331 [Methanococcoides burtonii DSM 6242]
MRNIIMLLAVVAMLITVPFATADEVDVTATISSAGNPPVIESMFVMDMVNAQYNESGDLDHLEAGTQIMPNPGAACDEVITDFYKFIVVSDPNGMQDIVEVYEKLFGTTDAQLGPEVTCADITNTADQDAALLAALEMGLITQAEYDNLLWMLDPLKQQAKMFKVANTLTNHDEPGNYSVYFKAVDTGGAYMIGYTYFDYMALKAIELDFTQVNYGPIMVNVEKWVAGDENWLTPEKPTIKNQGNQPLQITVDATDLIGTNLGQSIGAEALSVELLGEHVYDLSSPVTLQGFLMPCTPTQISFDITAPVGTAADSYTGDIAITIAP